MSIINLTGKFLDYLEVPFISTLAITVVSYSDILTWMKFLVLAATFFQIIYKIWSDREEKKRRRENENNNKTP
jgi:large-conductance mechanosensitive channel